MSVDGKLVEMADGRQLEVLIDGSSDQQVLFFHGGTPSAATPYRLLSEAAVERDLCLVTASRPGYGESDATPGRSVADVVSDVEEFGAALADKEALTAYLEAARAELRQVSGEQVGEAMGELVAAVDKAALTGEFADYVAASFRQAVLRGVEGWRDDDLAFVSAWGFDLADITVPVAIWQGGQDRMVPFGHGKWLAEHVPGARVHLYGNEGHLSLMAQVGRILDDLLASS